MENLKPNEERAKIAKTLIWIVLGIEMISMTFDFFQYDLLQAVSSGEEITMETATANDTRQQAIGIIYLVVFLVSSITFIQWFRRAYFNLHTRVDSLSYTDGLAAGGWFIPIGNLYIPYQIMKELFTETKELFIKKGLNDRSNLSISLVGWWWALWIMNGIVGQFLFRFGMKAETVDQLINTTIASIIGSIIAIPLAFLTVKVIKDYADAEVILSEIKIENETLLQNT